GKRAVDVEHVADHQGAALVAAQHAGRECPRDAQVLDVFGADLLERAVAVVLHVARLHRPVLRVLAELDDLRIGERESRQGGEAEQNAPRARACQYHLILLCVWLSGLRKNSSARRAPLNALYTRAKKNNMRLSKRRALLLFQNRTVMASLRCHKPGSARHVAALHRVAPDLQITLRGIPRLRRITEHAAALAAEALEARRGRSFHEIVIGVLLGDLV